MVATGPVFISYSRKDYHFAESLAFHVERPLCQYDWMRRTWNRVQTGRSNWKRRSTMRRAWWW